MTPSLSVIVAHKGGVQPLRIALDSMRAVNLGIPDVEVIVVETLCRGVYSFDAASAGVRHPSWDYVHVRIPRPPRIRGSPGLSWNVGVACASAPLVFITHSDVIHCGPLFEAALKLAPEHDWINFACLSVQAPPPAVVDHASLMQWSGGHIYGKRELCWTTTNWYVHSNGQRMVQYASAMTPEVFTEAGGFDFRFDDCYGCEDADFFDRMTFMAKISPVCDSPFVAHLNHERPSGLKDGRVLLDQQRAVERLRQQRELRKIEYRDASGVVIPDCGAWKFTDVVDAPRP